MSLECDYCDNLATEYCVDTRPPYETFAECLECKTRHSAEPLPVTGARYRYISKAEFLPLRLKEQL